MSSSEFKYAVLRKLVHVTLAISLALPYLLGWPDPLAFYTILTCIAASIHSILVKKPLVTIELKNMFKVSRRKVFDAIGRAFKAGVELQDLEQWFDKLENLVEEQIRHIEREYERKGGYIGIVYGCLGVLASQALFGDKALIGIMALTVIDPIAALVGLKLGKHRVQITGGSLEGSLASTLAFWLLLQLTGVDAVRALIISLATSLVELFSIEDNLAIPVIASLVAWALDTLL